MVWEEKNFPLGKIRYSFLFRDLIRREKQATILQNLESSASLFLLLYAPSFLRIGTLRLTNLTLFFSLEYMANSFGVTSAFIEREVAKFAAAGRLQCKIDSVAGTVITSAHLGDDSVRSKEAPDASLDRNILYQTTVKRGDILLNRLKKLARVMDFWRKFGKTAKRKKVSCFDHIKGNPVSNDVMKWTGFQKKTRIEWCSYDSSNYT